MLLAVPAALIGATLQSATGFGLVLVLGPALFAGFEPQEALTLIFLLSGTLNLLVLFAERRQLQVRFGELSTVLVAALPGVVLGVLILQALSKAALQVTVGVAVVLAAAVQARGTRLAGEGRASASSSATPAAVGLATGALTTSTGTSGPPLVLWFNRIGMTPHEMRDSLAAAFMVLNVLGAAALLALGEDPSLPGWADTALLLAVSVAGYLAGAALFRAVGPQRFRAAGLALVVLAGLASIAAGLLA